MSTPSTSEPRRQGRSLPNLPFTGRTGQAHTVGTASSPRPRTDGTTVISDAAERRLLATARSRGRKAVKQGALDPWILQIGEHVPYFAELAYMRDRVIGGIDQEARLTEEEARLADARAETDVSRCGTDTAMVEQELREAEEQIDAAKGQLDLLAQRATRWNRFRDTVRARLEAGWLAARFPSAESSGPARSGAGDEPHQEPLATKGSGPHTPEGVVDDEDPDGLQSVPRIGEAPRATAGRQHDTGRQDARARWHGLRGQTPPAPVTTDAWEGLTKRPGVPAWMNWSMLGVIFLVELPIYYAAYEPFHGIGRLSAQAQTLVLALGTGVAMVFFPHLAGRMLRWRPATGSVRSAWIPGYLLIGVWISLTGFLGTLRAKYLLQDTTPETATGAGETGGFSGLGGGQTHTLLERLHLSQTTVTSLFVALLLLSGGIGLLLGLFQEHPFLKAYRRAVEHRTELLRRHRQSVAATERARARANTAQARREDREEATRDQVRAVRALYDAAAAAYLDGVMTKSGDPAVTEAAMRLSRTWPLLPAPAHR